MNVMRIVGTIYTMSHAPGWYELRLEVESGGERLSTIQAIDHAAALSGYALEEALHRTCRGLMEELKRRIKGGGGQ